MRQLFNVFIMACIVTERLNIRSNLHDLFISKVLSLSEAMQRFIYSIFSFSFFYVKDNKYFYFAVDDDIGLFLLNDILQQES